MSHTTEQIRNIALSGHSGTGKTSLAEAIIFNTGRINRMGCIEDGTTVSDYDRGEIERKISLKVSLLNGDWNSHHFNIIDTPGYADFIGETMAALRVSDGTIVVVDADSGIEIGTERIWHFAEEHRIPRLLFINKMDHPNIDLEGILDLARDRLGRGVVQIQHPVNSGENFDQIVDLVQMKLLTYKNGKVETTAIPSDIVPQTQELHEQLVEAVAETDEELMEQYFNNGGLAPDLLGAGLRKAIAQLDLFPVCVGDACNNVGVDKLMDALIAYFPSPTNSAGLQFQNEGEMRLQGTESSPLAALVFKTIAEQHVGELTLLRLYAGSLKSGDEVSNSSKKSNERIGQIYFLNGHERIEVDSATAGDIIALVKLKNTHTGDTLCKRGGSLILPGIKFPEPLICVAITTKEKGNEERMATGLAQLHEEDPSLVTRYDGEIRQHLMLAQGELHLSTIIQRLTERFGVDVKTESPRIPYRETIRGNAEGHYRHKKQTGGRGQFGEVFLRISPRGRGEGFEFWNEVVGGNIPSNFIPAIEKGIFETLALGPLSGYQVVDVNATVYDGKYHAVDSDEISFKLAGSNAFKEAFLKARPVLLEPIYGLEVQVPEEFMGDVMGDLSSRRGRISGMDADGHFQIIHAEAPLAEIDRYATTLRSMTQGKGMHSQKFERYEEVPSDIMQKIIENSKKGKEAA